LELGVVSCSLEVVGLFVGGPGASDLNHDGVGVGSGSSGELGSDGSEVSSFESSLVRQGVFGVSDFFDVSTSVLFVTDQVLGVGLLADYLVSMVLEGFMSLDNFGPSTR